MATKISKETEAIQRGSSDKMGQIVGNTIGFFAGFVFAFIWGWEFTLILMGVAPFLSITIVIMIWGFTSGIKEEMKAYTQSGGYAEQALQAIQVVHTYGQEQLEKRLYKKYLDKSLSTGYSSGTKKAFGIAVFIFTINIFYAYAFYFAGSLRWNDFVDGRGNAFTGGSALVIIFCVLFSSFGFAGSAPMLASVQEGKIAGAFAFEVIDHVSDILPDEEGTKVLKREDVQGELTFENVSFNYPSKQESKVLKGLSCTFKAG